MAVTVTAVLAMVPFFCLYIEASKELHIRDGSMVDVTGRVVATAEYVSYASLFDLPSFSARTLATVRQVDLRLSATKEAVLSISGIVKHSACQAVTLYLPDGGELVIDGRTGTAVATIRNTRHVLQPPGRRMGELVAPPAPRLFSARELFGDAEAPVGAARGGPSRHLRELTEEGGWATLGIWAAEAILDDCSLDAAPHESVSISGKVMVGGGSAEMHAFYNQSDPRQSAVRVTHSDGRSLLADYAVGFEFSYDASGRLVGCEPAAGARAPEDELGSLEAAAVAGGAVLISGEDADGVEFLVQVEDFLLDSRSQPLERPPIEDCLALERRRLQGNGSAPPSGRRLDGSCGEWYSMSRAAYDHPDAWHVRAVASAGWDEVGQCKPPGANAHARVWSRGGQIAVGFAGSNDPYDWFNNLNILEHISGVHTGFVHYVEQVRPCIEQVVSQHGGQVHLYVGHSLGGAAATVYYESSGSNAADARVITYGAPKTHAEGGCVIPGTRYAHTSDPVASNFWGIMSNYHHKITGAVFYQDAEAHRRRRRWSWRRRRNWRWDSDLPAGCSQESDAGWVVNTAYHLAITHNSYPHGSQGC